MNENQIRDLVGEDNFILLMKMYGGGNLYIPKIESYLKEQRNEKIRELKNSGLTNRQLADRFGFSIQHIRNILSS